MNWPCANSFSTIATRLPGTSIQKPYILVSSPKIEKIAFELPCQLQGDTNTISPETPLRRRKQRLDMNKVPITKSLKAQKVTFKDEFNEALCIVHPVRYYLREQDEECCPYCNIF